MPSRICGTVIAGVHFFPPPGFADQEPNGDERESLMMMPTLPATNFVVRQPRLALGPLNTFLDPMLGLCHAGQFFQGRRGIRIRKVVVVRTRASSPATLSSERVTTRSSSAAFVRLRSVRATTGVLAI